jgi:hypothetical protein
MTWLKGPYTPRRNGRCLGQAALLFGNLVVWGAVIAVAVWAVWPR